MYFSECAVFHVCSFDIVFMGNLVNIGNNPKHKFVY